MNRKTKTKAQLLKEMDELECRLGEAEETLRAIRNGEVDALCVEGPEGDQIFTLKGKDQTYRTLIEEMYQGAVTTMVDGTILYANKAFAEMVRAPYERVVGTSIDQYIIPEKKPMFEALFQQGIHEPAGGEIALSMEKASPVPAYISIKTVLLEDEPVLCIAVTDLTQQERQKEIMESERLTRAILESAGEAIVVCDNDGRIIRANRLARGLVEYPILLNSFDDVFQFEMIPEKESETAAPFSLSQVLEGDPFQGREVFLKEQNKERRPFLLSVTHLQGEGGTIGCVLVLADITELKRLETELEVEKEQLAVTLFSIGDGVLVTDFEGRITLMNQVAESLTGWSLKEAISRPFSEVFHIINEKTRELCENPVEKVLETGRIVGLANDTVLISRDGTERVIADSGAPIIGRDGKGIGVVFVFRDVTEHKRNEKELEKYRMHLEELVAERTAELKRAQEALEQVISEHERVNAELRATLESIGDGFFACDEDWRFIYVNSIAERLLSIRREEVIGKSLWEVFPLTLGTRLEGEYLRAAAGEVRSFENFYEPWGRWFHNRCFPRQGGGMSVYFKDITERKQTEDALAKAKEQAEQRAIEIQRLALELSKAEDRERQRLANILHDDLQQILAYLKLKINVLGTGDEVGKNIDAISKVIDDSMNRCRNLSQELRPFIKQGEDFARTLTLLCRQMKERYGLEVSHQLPSEAGIKDSVLISLLIRSIRELLFNVVKHSGGTCASIILQLDEDRMLITVKDEGKGCDSGTLSKKREDKSAFGLLDIEDRVHLLGGFMEIESEAGHGFCVKLGVPIGVSSSLDWNQRISDVDKGPGLKSYRPEVSPVDSEASGRISVLLADDHKLMRNGLAELIKREDDIDVVGVAGNGEEAIELVDKLRPNMVVMDVTMPVMDGIEATRHISRSFPGITIIGLTVHKDRDIQQAILKAGAQACLSKEEDLGELIRAIRRAYQDK